MKPSLIFSSLISLLILNTTAAESDLEPWPDPEAGVRRFVFRLPELADEEDRQVEIIVGKTLKLDRENRYFFGGTLTRETIEGWGYSLYRLEKAGPLAGTLIAVPEDVPREDRFIMVNSSAANFIRYNSKLPVVVYVPEGFEVKYRVWEAGKLRSAGQE